MKLKTYAIDYYTAFCEESELWSAWIKDAQQRGHTVIAVTVDTETPGVRAETEHRMRHFGVSLPLVFTGTVPTHVALTLRGYKIDAYICGSVKALILGSE